MQHRGSRLHATRSTGAAPRATFLVFSDALPQTARAAVIAMLEKHAGRGPVAVGPSIGGVDAGHTGRPVEAGCPGNLALPFSMTAALAYTKGYRAI